MARKEDRRIQMGLSIARFPFVRTLDGFDFSAQTAVDPAQIRELACGRWIANGDALLLLGPPRVSGDAAVATATLDRLLHHSLVSLDIPIQSGFMSWQRSSILYCAKPVCRRHGWIS